MELTECNKCRFGVSALYFTLLFAFLTVKSQASYRETIITVWDYL